MKKPIETTELKFYCEGFSDPSVGLEGRDTEFSIVIEKQVWDEFDEQDKKEFIRSIKENVGPFIDPDGKCYTLLEWELMNESCVCPYCDGMGADRHTAGYPICDACGGSGEK